MFVRIVFLLEILAIVACIHAFYGKKAKFNNRTMVLIVLLILVCEVMNNLQIGEITSIINFILIYFYCKIEYKDSYIKTGINVLVILVCVTILQFICLLIMALIIPHNALVRSILVNIEVLCLEIYLLPKISLYKLRENIQWKNKYIKFILGFVGVVIGGLLFYDKVNKGIIADWFVFSIPAIAVILWLLGQWSNSKVLIDRLEMERESNITLNSKYQELLLNMRMRQHEFKNHIAVLFSTHYTYKTYEKLVAVQKEYCDRLLDENKYNGLLLIDNNILAAFLYEKFKQAESDGITVEHSIKGKINDCTIPTYYLVEMLGILFDNAVEAVKKQDCEKKIIVSVTEDVEVYQFVISNKFNYVPYEQIAQWFKLDSTSKGVGRGLGLYHIKELCEEWKCDIGCQNVDKEGINWIQFMLEVKKVGNHQ